MQNNLGNFLIKKKEHRDTKISQLSGIEDMQGGEPWWIKRMIKK